jgi:hypothetical protein
MIHMKKPQRSIRVGRKVFRLTINPVILSQAESASAPLRLSEIVIKAEERFPDLPLSWAVEGYIHLLLCGVKEKLEPYRTAPLALLPPAYRRFQRLSPSQKIRTGERWKKELRTLRNLHEGRTRV